LYTGAETVVRTENGNGNGSALSPLLFVIVMESLSREFRGTLP